MPSESSGEFLRRGAKPEVKKPVEYERAEMEADLGVFTDEERLPVEKYLRDESLEPAEAEIMRAARARWFFDKYGVPYHSKSARQEVLMRKYAPPEELAQAHALQEKMFAMLGGNATLEEIGTLKKEYMEKYPDQLEGIDILFDIRSTLELRREFSGDPKQRTREYSKEEKLRAYQDLTEANFLLAHFVKANNGDKEFLSLFWSALENITRRAGLSKELNITRKGIVTQVATMRIFEELGLHPQLSHPRDDAFNKIDMWDDASRAIQIKSTGADELEIIETDTLVFPGAQIEHDGETKHIASNLLAEAQKFGIKLKEYRRLTKQPNLRGFFITIPHSKVDFATGEPDPELIATVRRKLGGVGTNARQAEQEERLAA